MLSLTDTARRRPDHPALIVGDRIVTFAQMARRVASTARRLPASPPEGGGVAFAAASNEATLLMLWAVLERGEPAVLLHPRSPEPERNACVDQARPSRVLGADEVSELAATSLLPGDHRGVDALRTERDRRSDESIAAVLFSSGSTGTPKGVRLSHRAFEASAAASAANLRWRDDDRWLLTMPIAHAGGLSIVTRCALAGRAVILHERFDPDRFLDAPRQEGATLASVVPTMLKALLGRDHRGALLGYRAILVGGAPTPDDVLLECRQRGIPVVCTYGLTEACSQVATWSLPAEGLAEAPLRPLSGVEVRVADEAGDAMPAGAVGRLWVRGPVVMSGYCGGPDHAANAWLDTGDLGSSSPDGALTVAARRRDLIITGGENVYPAEVEQVISGCPGIAAAVVFGVRDEHWGEIVAVAIEPRGDGFRIEDLDRELRRRLASFRRPRRYCVLSALPVASVDKPNRRHLAAALAGALHPWPTSFSSERAQDNA